MSKTKKRLLFICLGNICRSPAAEGVMKKMVADAGLAAGYEIDSAGIGDWHVGQLPDSRMRNCGARRGYNFNSRARQFDKTVDFDRFDNILVMDRNNYRAITSMAPDYEARDKVHMLDRLLCGARRGRSRSRSLLWRRERLLLCPRPHRRCVPRTAWGGVGQTHVLMSKCLEV